MRQDFFTYLPQFLLMVYGNHKPGLKTVDEAIRRRIKLTPFTVFIPPEQRDNELTEKLKPEWSGILSWMIEGCLIWQREGLVTPAAVEQATQSYLATEDAVGRWMEECCTRDPQAHEAQAKLFTSWSVWAKLLTSLSVRPNAFHRLLMDRGFGSTKGWPQGGVHWAEGGRWISRTHGRSHRHGGRAAVSVRMERIV